MNALRYLAITILALAWISCSDEVPESKSEHYTSANATKVFSWETVKLLSECQVEGFTIDAKNPQGLASALSDLASKDPATKSLRFDFESISEITAFTLNLNACSLLDVVRFSAELAGITFDVKKDGVYFRPAHG